MSAQQLRADFMPWAGLALGTLGFFVQHQLGSDSVFQDCRVASPWIVIAGAVIGLLIIAAGAAGSWKVFGSQDEAAARRLVAAVSLMTCALYAIGTLLPVIATLIIPGCWG